MILSGVWKRDNRETGGSVDKDQTLRDTQTADLGVLETRGS